MLAEIDLQNVPPLCYQILLLSSKVPIYLLFYTDCSIYVITIVLCKAWIRFDLVEQYVEFQYDVLLILKVKQLAIKRFLFYEVQLVVKPHKARSV